MKKLLSLILLTSLTSCGGTEWTQEEVTEAMTACVARLDEIPCPPGIPPGTDCSLGDATQTACECLIQASQSDVTAEEFEEATGPGDHVLESCDAAATIKSASETCLTTLECPAGVPAGISCAIILTPPPSCEEESPESCNCT